MVDREVLAGHRHELRRGTLVLAALALLRRPEYGYALLAALTDAGFEVDGNTLYPLLRRLEGQGLLTSAWNTEETRPRKFYETTPAGAALLAELVAEWDVLDGAVRSLAPPRAAHAGPAPGAPTPSAAPLD
jgi:DNA-binding PadR family transcriptional regulator